MVRAVDLLRQGRSEELWDMCCGYLRLSLEQFMKVQKNLLNEQINLLNKSELGRKIMPGSPRDVEEFRKMVPLTTYKDYCPDLLEQKEAALPGKTAHWVHTSGKSSEAAFKWVPYSAGFAHELGLVEYGLWMLSYAKEWGDTSQLKECPKIVYTVAPPPYMSGTLAEIVTEQSPVQYFPSLNKVEGMPYDARIKVAFEQALSEGLDCFFGISLVLSVVGKRFSENLSVIDVLPYFLHPKALYRLACGKIKSKLAKRPMLPKDLWSIKGIISSGLDSSVYKDSITEMWGKSPLDIYACTEGGIIATQAWDCTDMTFIPTLNFLEFIPEKENIKWQADHSYQPQTVLLDEVEAGQSYEVVITNLRGGSLVRYRMGDIIKITSLSNENLGINLPQMAFERRADDLLDFVVVRVTEKSLWQAIEGTGVPYADWVACKDPEGQLLNVYLEPKNGAGANDLELAEAIRRQLVGKECEEFVNEFNGYINFNVKVHLLENGAFTGYMAYMQARGADMAHLKPPHINPSNNVLSLLQSKSAAAKPPTKKEKVTV